MLFTAANHGCRSRSSVLNSSRHSWQRATHTQPSRSLGRTAARLAALQGTAAGRRRRHLSKYRFGPEGLRLQTFIFGSCQRYGTPVCGPARRLHSASGCRAAR